MTTKTRVARVKATFLVVAVRYAMSTPIGTATPTVSIIPSAVPSVANTRRQSSVLARRLGSCSCAAPRNQMLTTAITHCTWHSIQMAKKIWKGEAGV